MNEQQYLIREDSVKKLVLAWFPYGRINSRKDCSFSSAEIKHFRTENTRSKLHNTYDLCV